MKLKAEDKGGYYLLNGTKMWIAGWLADTWWFSIPDRAELGARGMTAFLIEKACRAFLAPKKLDKLGMCAAAKATGRLVFNNVSAGPPHPGRLNSGTKVLMRWAGLRTRSAVAAGDRHHAVGDGQRRALHPRPQTVRALVSSADPERSHTCTHPVLQAGRSFCYTVNILDLLGTPTMCGRSRKDTALRFFCGAPKNSPGRARAMQIFGGNGYNDYPHWAVCGATPNSEVARAPVNPPHADWT
jgi:isovaleryl-CoA dehydrogenase